MFWFELALVCLGCLNAVNSYDPRNIPHDDLIDDVNNVREQESKAGDLPWEEIFADEYERMKDNDQKELDLDDDDDLDGVFEGRLKVSQNWKVGGLPIGQVGGLASDSKGLLYILHRAGRPWVDGLFNSENNYIGDRSFIKENTMMVVNVTDGRIVQEWGKNLFAMPHGLEIDPQDNLYVTDVALHQVFKFKPGQSSPVLTLGKSYRPATTNDDRELFCKPTDVAVASNGDFFVSDGYCASRILKYDREGHLQALIGIGDSNIPHSLALAEKLDLLCVADREGMRILCYKAGIAEPSKIGKPVSHYFNDRVGPIYAITFDEPAGLLYGVSGRIGLLKAQGFTVDISDNPEYQNDFIAFWAPSDEEEEEEEDEEEGGKREEKKRNYEGFTNPHAVTSSRDSQDVYVGEVGPNVVWKFTKAT